MNAGSRSIPITKPGDVVERGGDDAAVRPARCTLERATQHDVGDHFVALEAHVELDTRGIGTATHRPVGEPRFAGPGWETALRDPGAHQRHPVALRAGAECVRMHSRGNCERVHLVVVSVVRGEGMDQFAERGGGFQSGLVGRHRRSVRGPTPRPMRPTPARSALIAA